MERVVCECGAVMHSQTLHAADVLCSLLSLCCLTADFPANPPARATFAVKDLPKGGLVEIEAVAVHN